MTNVMSKTMLDRYLTSLSEDEQLIATAADAYERAKVDMEVILKRYVSLRNHVAEQIGKSPYSHDVHWPENIFELQYTPDRIEVKRGRFRFSDLPVGDAVAEVLRERYEQDPDEPWMNLTRIIEVLSEGGLGFPEPVQARAVNAALLKTSGVKRGTV